MPTVSCRSLWTGQGPCLSDVVIHVDDSGEISSIENCSSSCACDYNFAMPSFVDAHVHYTWMVVKEASLDLSDIRSSGEFLSFEVNPMMKVSGSILSYLHWQSLIR